jgi:hypothetical protein
VKEPATARQKRARRNKNCQLGPEGHNEPFVTTVYNTRVCQAHFDMLDEMSIAEHGHGLRQRPAIARAA